MRTSFLSHPRPSIFWGLLGALAACQSADRAATDRPAPPTGHYEGTLTVPGRPAVRAALELRHPSPGRYDAELAAPDVAGLSFVVDTLAFGPPALRLARPGRPGQTLALTQDGDFWRGTLQVDSVRYAALLVRRGPPEPAAYRVRRLRLPTETAVQLVPADETTPGPALLVLPTADAATATSWADVLARQGVAVQLPLSAQGNVASDTALSPARLRESLARLRGHHGVDPAQVGLWVGGAAAAGLPAALTDTAARLPRLAFAVLLHPPAVAPRDRAAWRQLARRLPVLALYSQSEGAAALSMQAALAGGRRGRPVRRYPNGPASAAQMQVDVVDWLRQVAQSVAPSKKSGRPR